MLPLPPLRSKCPTCAEPLPAVLLVQLLQVWSAPSVYALPSGVEPVMISCWFGVSPTPLIGVPFSSIAVFLLRLFPSRACSRVSPWRSESPCATRAPLALDHGPL